MKRLRFFAAVILLLAGMVFLVSNTTQAAPGPLPDPDDRIVWSGSASNHKGSKNCRDPFNVKNK